MKPQLIISHEGQPYVDNPVMVNPKRNAIRDSISRAVGNELPQPVTVGYERIELKWVRPDGTPKYCRKESVTP